MPSPFDNIDFTKLTVEDINKIENLSMRNALLDAIRRRDDLAASHQNHGSHGDHTTSSLADMQLEFAKNLLRTPR